VLFREIKSLALLNFSLFSFLYCLQACNKVVDALANAGAKMVLKPKAIWLGRIPTFV
jgi:hypothetical protein